MKKLLKFIFFLMIVLPFISVEQALAATNVSLSPSSGTVGAEFDITVSVNTGTDEINGISLDVTYDGSVSYSSGSSGNLGCTPIIDGDTDGVVSITCFIPPGETFSGQGTLATLSFTGDSEGSVDFGVTGVDVAGSTEGTIAGASLTVDPDYTGAGSDDGDTTGGELPETGILSDNILLISGVVLFILGIGVAFAPDTWNWMTFKMKQFQKRKEKYEKDVKSKTE